jgi:hypothetical protein
MSPEVVRQQYETMRDEFFLNDVAITFIYGGMEHQFLYLQKYGRRHVDSLWHHARPQDLTHSVIAVCSDTRIQAVDDEDYLIYTSRGSARHVGEKVAMAIRLLQRHPQPLSAIAQRIEGQGAPTHGRASGLSSDLDIELLLLLKLHYLECRQEMSPEPQRNSNNTP